MYFKLSFSKFAIRLLTTQAKTQTPQKLKTQPQTQYTIKTHMSGWFLLKLRKNHPFSEKNDLFFTFGIFYMKISFQKKNMKKFIYIIIFFL